MSVETGSQGVSDFKRADEASAENGGQNIDDFKQADEVTAGHYENYRPGEEREQREQQAEAVFAELASRYG